MRKSGFSLWSQRWRVTIIGRLEWSLTTFSKLVTHQRMARYENSPGTPRTRQFSLILSTGSMLGSLFWRLQVSAKLKYFWKIYAHQLQNIEKLQDVGKEAISDIAEAWTLIHFTLSILRRHNWHFLSFNLSKQYLHETCTHGKNVNSTSTLMQIKHFGEICERSSSSLQLVCMLELHCPNFETGNSRLPERRGTLYLQRGSGSSILNGSIMEHFLGKPP